MHKNARFTGATAKSYITLGLLGTFWEPSGGLLGASWERLAGFCGLSGCHELRASESFLGASGNILGAFWYQFWNLSGSLLT